MIKGSQISERLYSLFEKGEAEVKTSIQVDGSDVNDNNPLPTERPLNTINSFTHTLVTTSGNVPSGKYAITFKFSSDFIGTLQGTSVEADEIIPINTDYNSVLPQINYTISQGSIRILTLEP